MKKRNPSKEAELVLKCAEKLGYDGVDNGLYEVGTGSLYITIWYNSQDGKLIQVKLRFSDHPTGYTTLTTSDYELNEGNPPDFLSIDPDIYYKDERHLSGLKPYQAVAYLAERIGKKKPAWVVRQEKIA
ncbi:MAG: hypothetical protein AB1424_08920 [Thermodesulfobacteriota bacterium]